MEEKKNVQEEIKDTKVSDGEETPELYEEVEETVTASWIGCANCCN